jgi:hypothetical protein
MRPSRSSLTPNRDEKLGVSPCNSEVIINDRERRHNIVDEALAAEPGFSLGQLRADLQLGQRNGCDGDVIVVIENVVEIDIRSVRVDKKGRVKKQPTQNRSSATTNSRASRMTIIH